MKTLTLCLVSAAVSALVVSDYYRAEIEAEKVISRCEEKSQTVGFVMSVAGNEEFADFVAITAQLERSGVPNISLATETYREVRAKRVDIADSKYVASTLCIKGRAM